ncbi:50S ribosomal protein L25 [Buchnera aphidicola]|uniref:50S ribosomal protein L25 n=1 Tax=Buchnera aphidicola TaxID=9 RepID=UPI0031B87622
MKIFIKAYFRNKLGTKNSRRLRKEEKCPCILYSLNNKEIPIYLKYDEIFKLKNIKNVYNKKIIIIFDKINYLVKINEIQRHIFKNNILHIDFFLIKKI